MQCGVIECVPNSKSRDQLGKATQVSLKAYFNSHYGDDDSVEFQEVCTQPSSPSLMTSLPLPLTRPVLTSSRACQHTRWSATSCKSKTGTMGTS